MRNPVCPLFLSLYGHPDLGGCREQRCEGHVAAKGFGLSARPLSTTLSPSLAGVALSGHHRGAQGVVSQRGRYPRHCRKA
eukprot:6363783-Pyramimonas_sp.AAC.1